MSSSSPGPAEVVEVVPDPLRVASLGPEAGDRAVHDATRAGRPGRSRAGPRRRAGGPSSTTSAREQIASASDGSARRSQVTDSFPRPSALIPARRGPAKRVPVRRLDPNDSGAEPRELPARERDRQVPGQLGDENALERLRVHLHGPYSDRALTDRSIAQEQPGPGAPGRERGEAPSHRRRSSARLCAQGLPRRAGR